MSDKIWNGYDSEMKLTFDQKVHITESLYPPMSLPKFFSDLGGSLGFWLGVGLLQICYFLIDMFKHIRAMIL